MSEASAERCPTCWSPYKAMTRDPFVHDLVTFVPMGPWVKCRDPWHDEREDEQMDEVGTCRFMSTPHKRGSLHAQQGRFCEEFTPSEGGEKPPATPAQVAQPGMGATPKLRDALRVYAEAMGGLHEDDCPCDDTCNCEYKWVNDAINAACNEEIQ